MSPLDEELKKLEEQLAEIDADDKQNVAGRLRALLATITDEPGIGERILAATTPDELFQLIDELEE